MKGNLPPCRAPATDACGMMAPFAPSSAPAGLTMAGILFLNVPNLANLHRQDRNDTREVQDFGLRHQL
jgi:hypothetical protein